jgi:hypothetical protein
LKKREKKVVLIFFRQKTEAQNRAGGLPAPNTNGPATLAYVPSSRSRAELVPRKATTGIFFFSSETGFQNSIFVETKVKSTH